MNDDTAYKNDVYDDDDYDNYLLINEMYYINMYKYCSLEIVQIYNFIVK